MTILETIFERDVAERLDRRATDPQCWDAALIMGLLYTVIYGGVMALILLIEIPTDNAKTIDILAGAMTIIQTTIVQYFFGSSKNAENSQRLIAQSKERTDSTLREIVSATTVQQPTQGTITTNDVKIDATNVDVNTTKP